MTKFWLKLSAATVVAAAALITAAGRDKELRLEVTVGRTHYAIGDTVVVGVKAAIPQGYHLYSNPLGPGIGKPLNLFVNQPSRDKRVPYSITWIEARKSFPKRYNPPIGSWVWAYESEAYFFVKGVLVKDSVKESVIDSAAINGGGALALPAAKTKAAPAKTKAASGRKAAAADTAADATPPPSVIAYEIIVEALICQTACVPVAKNAPFDLPLPIEAEKPNLSATAFPAGSSMQSRYAKSEPVAFKAGAPDAAALLPGGGAAGLNAVNLDLSGLSSLAGAPPLSPPIITSEPPPENPPGEPRQSPISGASNNGDDAAYGYSPLEEKREYNLLTAILFALVAGLALNLTPCIFPLLGVRALSFAQSALESRRSAVVRSVAFSLGIVSVFLLLAAFAAFAGFSWGQQFQSPGMMVGIIALVFLFALGLFDFYTLSVPAAIGNAERKAKANLAGDFLKGAIATVMATPCGGPFLGALLAWALLQKPLTIFILFAVMGVGMALPYVFLSSSKRLMGLLPKPGRWIEDFKHFMGFLLLAFAVNMMRSLDPRLTATAVGICLSLLFAASVHKRFAPFGVSAPRRAAVVSISVALLTIGAIISVAYLRVDAPIFNDDQAEQADSAPAQWAEFSAQTLRAAHAEGRSVIVNFTASWCTNCKLNKAAALNTADARRLYADKNILLLTADITNHNPEAQELLHHLGSRSVPFLAIFPADAPIRPVVMRDIISKDKFLGELRGLP
ncbi:MAG: thioredoxin family protein [Chitinispirillales bacterium]|jgi:thiol:disulfide interchange protein|nr:thioredoxin family protein [Chitinispirillales bacterium]